MGWRGRHYLMTCMASKGRKYLFIEKKLKAREIIGLSVMRIGCSNTITVGHVDRYAEHEPVGGGHLFAGMLGAQYGSPKQATLLDHFMALTLESASVSWRRIACFVFPARSAPRPYSAQRD